MAFNRVALAAALLASPPERADHRVSSVARDGRSEQRYSGIIEDRGSTYGYVPGKAPSDLDTGHAGPQGMQVEMDMAEVDLTSWGLPETLLPQNPLAINTIDSGSRQQSFDSSRDMQGRPSSSPFDRINSPSSAYSQPVKPAVASLSNRRNRKGRTVSFHDYTSILNSDARQEEDPMEELAQHESSECIVRPRSSMSVMNRGRPTSPFNAPQASPTAASFAIAPAGSVPLPSHVPLPPSPGPGQMNVPPSPSRSTQDQYDEPNPFALPAPAGPRLSRFDPKVMTPSEADDFPGSSRGTNVDRPVSQASGYFPQVDSKRRSLVSPPQHPSTMSRLRPRTLLMPTPLQGTLDPTQSQPSRWEQEGFSHGAKPMPPGALTRPDSFVGQLSDKSATKRFSSSQQLFRVTLAGVDGKRDSHVSGHGYEPGFLNIPPSAEKDGEVGVQQYGGRDGYGDDDSEFDEEYLAPGEQDWRPETRYVEGPSLMDRLEARKAELRNKQRVFRGDNRPAMMSRSHTGPLVDLNGIVDPLTGQTSPRLRQNASLTLQDEDGRPLVRSVSQGDQAERPLMSRGKSVFGVDTLWEKELKKLEAQKESERALAIQMEEGRKKKGAKKGKKDKKRGEKYPEQYQDDVSVSTLAHPHTETMLSQGREEIGMPPSLSLSDLATTLHEPYNPSEGSIAKPIPHINVGVDDWAAGSDEEGATPQPRRRKRRTIKPVPPVGSDSEDDVPLAKAFGISRPRSPGEHSDTSEDEPLSNLQKKKVSSRTLDAVDEDDIPLALRRAQKPGYIPAQSTATQSLDEDDMPLAQRRLRAQQTGITDPGLQQQHHLAMAMAQQQHQSMMMHPMSMYGGMPMMNMGMGMGMGMPMGMPSPMGMMPGTTPFGAFNNASAYSLAQAPPPDPKIDRWRREVEAREGSVISAPPSVVTSGGRTTVSKMQRGTQQLFRTTSAAAFRAPVHHALPSPFGAALRYASPFRKAKSLDRGGWGRRWNSSSAPAVGGGPNVAIEPRLSMTMTCTAGDCGHRSTHEFTKRSYQRGIVIIQCPECKNRHLIADHLDWFKESTGEGKLRTIEDVLAARGEKVQRGKKYDDGTIEIAGDELDK
ncbi:hypothetical protein QFC19_003024 [Naganishia cerealis]|uniref:Uncharacterized protein n=1 Tax=Naganishia cerealis TaxID=610337 RepID=A0ACC2W7X7_9TREE|nr:hypothetical protein QFC19_003024 [Naganishia cerealis]